MTQLRPKVNPYGGRHDIEHLTVRVAGDHHERNNGSGYPGGMNLNDRAVEIVVVCDIYAESISIPPV
jgi:HD-GYP domain-containing protein (c-di-GMP phosphodiesterase class II)